MKLIWKLGLVVFAVLLACNDENDCSDIVRVYLDETLIVNDYALTDSVTIGNQAVIELLVILSDSAAKVVWESPQGGQFLNNANELKIRWKAPFIDRDSLFLITVTATRPDSTYDEAGVLINVKHNRPPTVQINAPKKQIHPGGILPFEVIFGDPDEDPVRLQSSTTGGIIVLQSDITQSPIAAEWIAPTSQGYYLIFAVASDGEMTVSDTVVFQVTLNQSPVVSIRFPQNNTSFHWKQLVTFEGSAIDEEDGLLPPERLAWSSSLSGMLGYGDRFTRSDLNAGQHTITLRATDNLGEVSIATVHITVQPNSAPQLNITSPNNGANFVEGENITFQCSSVDAEDGRLDGFNVLWISSKQGIFGSGASFQSNILRDGNHVITVEAHDSENEKTTAQINISLENNDPPEVQILVPSENQMFFTGEAITFSGSAVDPERGDLPSNAFRWSSSISGNLGAGNPLVVPNLAAGQHIITLVAADDEGNEGQDQITIRVQDVIRVPQQYPTIQQGINAAGNGDYVVVDDGTYSEALSIPSGIILVSENGPSKTTINGRNLATIVSITGNSVLDGFTLDGDTTANLGISVIAGNPEIKHVIIREVKNGMVLQPSAQCYFHNSIIWYCTDLAVEVKSSGNLKFHNNIIFKSLKGGMKFSGGGDVRNCLVGECGTSQAFHSAFTCSGTGGAAINYTMYWSNSKTTSGCSLGTGNRSDFPRFINSDIGDFRLQSNSSARNTGDPNAIYNDTDGSRNDMGPYGGQDPLY